MVSISDWLPNALVGVTFTTLGLAKVYGWRKGIVGGGGKPASCRLMGRCPSWSKQVNIIVIALFLAIGIANLVAIAAALLKSAR
jgi:hypothetical protein